MSQMSRRLAGAGIGVLALLAAAPVLAADLAYPPYPGEDPGPSRIDREEQVEAILPPPPPPRPAYGPRFAVAPYAAPPPPEVCRTIVRRRIDEDGEEVERRIRICDAPAYPPVPHYRPSFYRPPPVPPADIPYGRWAEPPRW